MVPLIRDLRCVVFALALLRPRRVRPRSCRAAEQRDELAALQLIELHPFRTVGLVRLVASSYRWVHGSATEAFHALFGRIGSRAKMQFPIHPHMLRHGCGYALANAGHDTRALQAWLGHRNIQHTVRYTELAPDRFKNFWRD